MTILMRIDCDAMMEDDIRPGDLLVVEKNLKPISGNVVVVNLNGDLLVRRLDKSFNKIRLVAASSRLSTIEIDTSSCDFSILGVATYCIRPVA